MVLLTEQIIKGKTRLDKLDEVKNLNLWGQELDDCSILSKLPNLEVLSLSVNKLSSLKDFRHCTKLQELYLRKNDVQDLNEIQHLVNLKELKVLWLSDNPCADHPNYKQFVARMLPQLQKLDNDDISSLSLNFDAAPPPPPTAAAAAPARAGSASSTPPPAAGPSPYGTPQHAAERERAHSRGSAGVSPAEARGNGAGGGGGGGGRSTKNILYAVMALLGELEDEDLVYVRREIEQRIGGR